MRAVQNILNFLNPLSFKVSTVDLSFRFESCLNRSTVVVFEKFENLDDQNELAH